MSGYGTKKATGDVGVQLTFPAEFQKAYAMMGAPISYYPSLEGSGFDIMVGSDEQAQYHEQKRLDADKSVMDGLQARRTAEQKLLTGPHNYHVPKPVLSQRRYANPSLGDVGFSSTRRDNGMDAPFRTVEVGDMPMMGMGKMRGGVRTNEGYSFYRGQLQRRVGQLDRLDALAQGFAVPMGQEYETEDRRFLGSSEKIEFFFNLQNLQNNVVEGNIGPQPVEDIAIPTATATGNLRATLVSLLKFGPTADEDDFRDMIKSFDIMLQSLRPEDDDQWGEYQQPEYTQTVIKYLVGMRRYAVGMSGGTVTDELGNPILDSAGRPISVGPQGLYLQPKERETLSKSLARTLFKGMLRDPIDRERLNELQRQARHRRGDFSSGYSGPRGPPARDIFDDEEDGDDGDEGSFDRPASTREDSEFRGIPRAPFSGRAGDPLRERFGAVGRRGATIESAFFGEDGGGGGAGDGPYLAYPLGEAGYDPAAEGAPVEGDVGAISDALDSVIESVLEPLKTEADRDLSLDEVVAKHYPQKQVFVNEVERAMEERGFSKPQIASAMSRRTDDDVFDSYVAENSGPTGPARAEPARRFRPDTSAFAPVYGESASAMTGLASGPPSRGAPSGEFRSPAELLASIGFPANRDELRIQVRSISDLRRVGALLTPPYVPRDGTKLVNGITALISKVRKIDPSY